MIPDEDGNTGSSSSPCSDTFSGAYALSESECSAIDKFLNDHTGIFDVFLAVSLFNCFFLLNYPFFDIS